MADPLSKVKLAWYPDILEFMVRRYNQFQKFDRGDLKKPKYKMWHDLDKRYPMIPPMILADPRSNEQALGTPDYVAKQVTAIASEFWDRVTKIYREDNIKERFEARNFGKLYFERKIRMAEAEEKAREYSNAMTELLFATMLESKNRVKENAKISLQLFHDHVDKNWEIAIADFNARWDEYKHGLDQAKEQLFIRIKNTDAEFDKNIEKRMREIYEATAPDFAREQALQRIESDIEEKLAVLKQEDAKAIAIAYDQKNHSINFAREVGNQRLDDSRKLRLHEGQRLEQTIDVNAEVRMENFYKWKREQESATAPDFNEEAKRAEVKELIQWKGTVFNLIQAVAAAAIAGTYFPARSTSSVAAEYISKHVRNHKIPRIGGVVNIKT